MYNWNTKTLAGYTNVNRLIPVLATPCRSYSFNSDNHMEERSRTYTGSFHKVGITTFDCPMMRPGSLKPRHLLCHLGKPETFRLLIIERRKKSVMRKLTFLVLVLLLAFACKKDDDPKAFNSVSGYWIVRTTDDITTVSFTIIPDADNDYAIESASVTYNGDVYTAQPIDTRIITVSDTEIESITFRSDDFIIRLLEITAINNFTELQISNSTFVIDGIIREFAMIKATRK